MASDPVGDDEFGVACGLDAGGLRGETSAEVGEFGGVAVRMGEVEVGELDGGQVTGNMSMPAVEQVMTGAFDGMAPVRRRCHPEDLR